MIFTKIAGTGSYIPRKILTNNDLKAFVDTSDEWISSRTGIKERHIVIDESTLDLAYKASLKAIKSADISKDFIDLIIVATVTSDFAFPGVSQLLQAKLGIKDITAFDINAACPALIFAMDIAESFIVSGNLSNIVISLCSISEFINLYSVFFCGGILVLRNIEQILA